MRNLASRYAAATVVPATAAAAVAIISSAVQVSKRQPIFHFLPSAIMHIGLTPKAF